MLPTSLPPALAWAVDTTSSKVPGRDCTNLQGRQHSFMGRKHFQFSTVAGRSAVSAIRIETMKRGGWPESTAASLSPGKQHQFELEQGACLLLLDESHFCLVLL